MPDKDDLTEFLLDLSSNPERLERFAADPNGEAGRAGLSREERIAVISGNPSKIRERLAANDNGNGIMLRRPAKRRPGKGIMKKKPGKGIMKKKPGKGIMKKKKPGRKGVGRKRAKR
jgi:hypothetical protein